jgi:hypothetical protein
MLVLLLIVVLIILSLMFGGFQKGTKSGSLRPLRPPYAECSSVWAARAGATAIS